ncbi:MAG TPA: hypothetical protein VHT05_05640 [Candidatus Elarobacter sp.]|jgi:hypothetical protein|nr:hypothetical protein [Candidatus Elarobacter sp.]
MRIVTIVLAAAVTGLVATSPVRADTASPLPAPTVQPSPQMTRLSDGEIRTLLVGNSYTVDYHEGMRLTFDVHADGTVFGYVSAGMVQGGRGSALASRNQDDGKYTIANELYCYAFSGPWAHKDGKPTCAPILRSADGGYLLGKTPMVVTPAKH